MTTIVRRFAHVDGLTDAFVEALWQMSKERGGGYIPVTEVETRAATLHIVERVKLPPLPLPKLVVPALPPLPLPRLPCLPKL